MKTLTKKGFVGKNYLVFAGLLILTVYTFSACMRADDGPVTEDTLSVASEGQEANGEGTEIQNGNTDNNGGSETGKVPDTGNGPEGTPGPVSGEDPSKDGTVNDNGNDTGGNLNGSGDSSRENNNGSEKLPGENGSNSGDGTAENGSGSGEDTAENKKHIVVLDPGHGGKRGGAWYLGLAEKDLTLKVAQYARDYLLENYENIEVYLTREKDEALDPDNKIELEMRCDLAREVGADCLVSIHFNATDAHIQHGAEIWISRNKEIHDATLALGESIMAELEALGIRRNSVASRKSTDMFDENGIAIDYYAINRHCAARGIPGIIVEQCYMDNEIDQMYITSEEALKELGGANARGIANYLELKPKM